MDADIFVDASLFLGMHSIDERLRIACKALFVEAKPQQLTMTLEDVGRCDDVVWHRPRPIQDAYYPFMDLLHTELDMRRVGLNLSAAEVAVADERLRGLSDPDRFLLAMVLDAGGTLVTANPVLLCRGGLPVQGPEPIWGEPRFPPKLERRYRTSLALRIDPEGLAR